MDAVFDDNELLFRAVYPPAKKPIFWKNGRISSAALKDKRGLSVDRSYDRTVEESVSRMKGHFEGVIVSITVFNCQSVKAKVIYCPSKNNPYHSEIHGSETEIMLSDEQALLLARLSRIEYVPDDVQIA